MVADQLIVLFMLEVGVYQPVLLLKVVPPGLANKLLVFYYEFVECLTLSNSREKVHESPAYLATEAQHLHHPVHLL